MQIDVEQRRLAVGLGDDVVVPDALEERPSTGAHAPTVAKALYDVKRFATSCCRSATTFPTTTSAGVGSPCAASAIPLRSATTTSCSGVVPREITAAGVAGSKP